MPVSSNSAPRFWWRGALILLPVALLAGVGLWQLRHERLAVMEEARERAQPEVRLLLASAEGALRKGMWREGVRCEIDSDGAPVGLAFYANPPLPQIDTAPAAAELRALHAAEMALAERLAAARALSENAGVAISASGLPVAPLAARLAFASARELGLEAAELAALANAQCQLAVERPSVLSEALLEEAGGFTAEAAMWRARWREDEWLRAYFGALGGNGIVPWRWQQVDGAPVLARVVPMERGRFVEIAAVDAIRAVLHENVEAWHAVGTRYVFDWEIGGKWLRHDDGGGDNDREWAASPVDPIATAASGEIPLSLTLRLANMDALLESQAGRTRQLALLISLAALAAAVGWFASWRAFHAQVALARMKDNFASSVSHELRAPIASIRLMAESLESGRAEGEQKRREYARLIAGESARLGDLVENVLAFSRLESGRDAFEFEESDAGAALRAAVDLMQPAATERGITLEVDAPGEGELELIMDPGWVGRGLVNLLDNAIKYGPADSTTIASVKANADGGARFFVQDEGEPIPAAERERIFEKFYRRGSELTRETRGVGIGLSLVRRIAEAHGGRAWAENGGGGNRLCFEIDGNES